jgi:type III secretory pathway component EscR
LASAVSIACPIHVLFGIVLCGWQFLEGQLIHELADLIGPRELSCSA